MFDLHVHVSLKDLRDLIMSNGVARSTRSKKETKFG